MIIALVIGLFVAAIGALVSMAIDNWQFSFAISGVAAVMSIVMSSMFRNIGIISRKRAEARGEKGNKALEEGENWARALSLFGLPNIIITIVLYFKLYR
ncbi:hypothetical protein [Clostridium sp.]|jgi:membrane protein implicated in regulation of membrane protease activity|uniref:hypothetical protein n=1 Tax=Clostridium sp. TaxID=1506 RepID=UPI0039F603C9